MDITYNIFLSFIIYNYSKSNESEVYVHSMNVLELKTLKDNLGVKSGGAW